MTRSRKVFLAGAALAPVALLAESASAAVGDRAILLTLYTAPGDADVFDKYYFSTHEALVKQLPGVVSYAVSKAPVGMLGSASSPYHMITIVGFESMSHLMAALRSQQATKVAQDTKNFARTALVFYFSVSQA